MTAAGWILLLLFWSIILGLTTFCFYKIFTRKNGNGGRSQAVED